MNRTIGMMAAAGVLAACGQAMADYSIVQGSSAPTYAGQQLNFDESGTMTGQNAPDTWEASHGIVIDSGTGGGGIVEDWTTSFGFDLGDGNSMWGPFGIFITFTTDVTEMSAEVFDNGGPPGPFGGGMGIFLFDNGNEVANSFVTPAFGGVGDPWFDITTSGGMVFDEVRFVGFAFIPDTYIDNLSWNPIPAAPAQPASSASAVSSQPVVVAERQS